MSAHKARGERARGLWLRFAYAVSVAGLSAGALGVPRFRPAAVATDGRFEFRSVLQGTYTVLATANPSAIGTRAQGADGASASFATSQLSVADQPLIGLDTLRLTRAPTAAGRITLETRSAASPISPNNVLVRLTPVAPTSFDIQAVHPASDWRLTFGNVPPGLYDISVAVSSAPSINRALHVKRVVVDGKDATDTPVALGRGRDEDEFVVELTDQVTELSGSVIGPGGPTSDYYLVVFPVDSQLWKAGTRWLRAPGRPGTDGSYRLVGLPPGSYYVACVDDYDSTQWWSPTFLSSLIPSSIRIALSPGEVKAQNIAVGHSRVSGVVSKVRAVLQAAETPSPEWLRDTIQRRGLTLDPWR